MLAGVCYGIGVVVGILVEKMKRRARKLDSTYQSPDMWNSMYPKRMGVNSPPTRPKPSIKPPGQKGAAECVHHEEGKEITSTSSSSSLQ